MGGKGAGRISDPRESAQSKRDAGAGQRETVWLVLLGGGEVPVGAAVRPRCVHALGPCHKVP